MTITDIKPVIFTACNECGTPVGMDWVPWDLEDGTVCASCEVTITDAFYEQCWAFVDRITPPEED